jgi:hypothetical protein
MRDHGAAEFCTIPAMAQSAPLGEPPHLTAAGQAELVARRRGLSQRQRTVLFLVDGRRSEAAVRALAQQAGAGAQCLDELVALGLVGRAGAMPHNAGGGESSLLPSSQSLHGESIWSMLDEEAPTAADRPLAEARELLRRAVRQQAPVAGALTLIRLRRATTREQLEALLDEVEQRLRKPHRQIIAAQTMRHVRHLLSLPTPAKPR